MKLYYNWEKREPTFAIFPSQTWYLPGFWKRGIFDGSLNSIVLNKESSTPDFLILVGNDFLQEIICRSCVVRDDSLAAVVSRQLPYRRGSGKKLHALAVMNETTADISLPKYQSVCAWRCQQDASLDFFNSCTFCLISALLRLNLHAVAWEIGFREVWTVDVNYAPRQQVDECPLLLKDPHAPQDWRIKF